MRTDRPVTVGLCLVLLAGCVRFSVPAGNADVSVAAEHRADASSEAASLGNSAAPITQLITFAQTVSIVAGTQYAIVLNYPTAPPGTYGGSWKGATGDAYAGGQALKSGDGVTWSQVMSGLDQDFRTYVR